MDDKIKNAISCVRKHSYASTYYEDVLADECERLFREHSIPRSMTSLTCCEGWMDDRR